MASFGSVLSPLVDWLLPVRALLTLNLAGLAWQLRAAGFADTAQTAFVEAAASMVLGPFGVVLAVAGMLLLANDRPRAIRDLTHPTVVAGATVLMSVGVFGLQLPVIRPAVESGLAPVEELAGGPLLFLLAPFIGLWFLLFGLCSLFLIHHHAFGGRGNTLLDPLVSSWLAWMIAAVDIAVLRRNGAARPTS